MYIYNITDRKEMNCSRDSKILHGLVHDTTQISSCFSDFRVVSRTNSCSISESPLEFISFLTIQMFYMSTVGRLVAEERVRRVAQIQDILNRSQAKEGEEERGII